MFCLNDSTRYFLCPGSTDMRKGMFSLSGLIREKMNGDVRNGDVYIFINRLKNRIKLLHAETGGLASYYFFTAVFLNPQDPFQLMTANTLSWICAVSFAYITNRKFVFESKSADKLREMLKFFSARISTLLIEMACMTLLVNILHWNDRISKFAVQFIVMALNYIFSKLFVFRIKE